MNGAGRRRRDICDSSIVRTDAQSCAQLEYPRARVLYMAGCEFSPLTLLRPVALQSKRTCFHRAYGVTQRHQTRGETHRLTNIRPVSPSVQQASGWTLLLPARGPMPRGQPLDHPAAAILPAASSPLADMHARRGRVAKSRRASRTRRRRRPQSWSPRLFATKHIVRRPTIPC